jgi:hypothetical protein
MLRVYDIWREFRLDSLWSFRHVHAMRAQGHSVPRLPHNSFPAFASLSMTFFVFENCVGPYSFNGTRRRHVGYGFLSGTFPIVSLVRFHHSALWFGLVTVEADCDLDV